MLEGLQFFPVTPFTPAGTINPEVFAEHVRTGLDDGAGGVFVACGTGEFHALSLDEYVQLVHIAVEVTNGRVPVFAGTGGPLPMAQQFARAALVAGADGLLLLPPYLVQAPPAGLVAYTEAVASATELPLIVYHRGAARFDVESAVAVARLPQVVGLKDGFGDLELLSRIVLGIRSALEGTGKPFLFFNGLPTAEATVPAYRGIGVELYSSAVFCFAPEISMAFHQAVTKGDRAFAERLQQEFFHPLVALRDRVPGYAVSLVKAGVRRRGLDVGGVRAPLVDPSPEHLEALQRLTDNGLAICAGKAAR
ncbi:5-dehydro-4-deoxyglucarate dehydratase [Kitasatospora sp. NBC_00240]|uniref:5-dehydro-4-deoxyglucarate dehydratase n=1 Tax=Kitasatospora sp. NBC_00240 TaxID=2903567 RepID=UPI002258AB5C|nr:5-dehydro-4-deoxyglucarate dehydratase [Kitasatospora sp. NBC_00240]MCX5214717.1 5-dehydro-4-deoxyglucarate dehydratase [Kitasatospora sp. NBC_00240]